MDLKIKKETCLCIETMLFELNVRVSYRFILNINEVYLLY